MLLDTLLGAKRRTEDNDIKDEDDEAHHSTTGAVMPWLGAVVARRGDWSCRREREQREQLEEQTERGLEHVG
jgi:hypothetical protein